MLNILTPSSNAGHVSAPLLKAADLLSIVRSLPHDGVAGTSDDSLGWYGWWVQQQAQKEPKELFSILPYCGQDQAEAWEDSFVFLWQEISRYTVENNPVSIDEIILHLANDQFLRIASDSDAVMAKNLIFTILGWQTMLYRADARSCHPDQFTIADDMDGYKGQAHMCLKQKMSACQMKIHQFLLGFGVLLPPRNFNAPANEEDKEAFDHFKSVTTANFNAYNLTYLGGVSIKWVDSLACHLEFDAYSKTLFLFRYPSFCAANLSKGDAAISQKTVIHACAAPAVGAGQWATATEVTQMLRETIMSYRLLFGQSKAARRLFRKLRPFEGFPEHGRDNYLVSLCSRKQYGTLSGVTERETYDLRLDFPVLRSRMAVLMRHLSNKTPQTWKELWRDRRNSASWLTFWVVLIIGMLGVFLTFVQTVLQIVQVIQQNSQ